MLVKLHFLHNSDPCFIWLGPGVIFHRDQSDVNATGSLIYHINALDIDDGENYIKIRETPEEIQKLIQNSPGGAE